MRKNEYQWFREQLNEPVSKFMDELEAFAGLKITVMSNPERELWYNYPSYKSGLIEFNKAQGFSLHSAFHELLHLHYRWVRKSPILGATKRDEVFRQVVKYTEGAIEHVSMAVEEKQFGFDPAAFWTADLYPAWSQFELAKMKNSWNGKLFCLNRLLFKDTIDVAFYDEVHAALVGAGLQDLIDFTDEHRPLIYADKPRLVGLILKKLGISSRPFRFSELDVQRTKERIFEVPMP